METWAIGIGVRFELAEEGEMLGSLDQESFELQLEPG